jgi:hypothetical protein
MQATIELPRAFSVRDEHEFYPFQHLMERLNPKIMVEQVATGKHVNGGFTVFWGIVYLNGHKPNQAQMESALKEAGFDVRNNVLTQTAYSWSSRVDGE